MNKSIDKEIVVEIGLARVKNICACCKRKMDIKNYNIQLCKICRTMHLEEIIQRENKGDGMNVREYILTKNDANLKNARL